MVTSTTVDRLAVVRIARFTTGDDPRFGVVEGGEGEEVLAVVAGDPLYTPIRFVGERVPVDQVRLLAPVIPRSKVLGVARNYAAHASEMGGEVAAEPEIFLKPNTSVIGPGSIGLRGSSRVAPASGAGASRASRYVHQWATPHS